MSNYFFKCMLIVLCLGTLIFPVFIKAEILNDDFDLNGLKGKKLGYYIGSFDPIHLGHQYVIELRSELLEMQDVDQRARAKLINNKEDSDILWKDIQEIDCKNGQRLKEIISQYGWPGASLIGLDGSSALWLLVQHQDQDVSFQKQCLELLKIAVHEYEASTRSLAYLTDRVNKNEGRPQIYGTQWIQKDGKYLLYPVDDIEHLNERRSEMGLNTIEEYKKQIQAVYQLKDEDFI